MNVPKIVLLGNRLPEWSKDCDDGLPQYEDASQRKMEECCSDDYCREVEKEITTCTGLFSSGGKLPTLDISAQYTENLIKITICQNRLGH